MNIYFFIFLSLFNFIRADEDTLQLVHAFFRHGSRTPDRKDIYPSDPFGPETFWPMGYGTLTNKGKRDSFKLGEILRKRYDAFLGDIYIPEIIEAVSTDFERTKTTLLLVLAGLFPPSSIQTWNKSIPWLPIPINFDQDRDDFTLRRPTKYCPSYVQELEKVMSSDDVQRDLKLHQSLFKYVEEHTKKSMKTLLNMFDIYQTLDAEATMNLTLPEWAQSVYPEKLHTVAGKQCNYENYNAILKRLNGGRILGKIIEHMIDKSKNVLHPSDRKIYLYSGHENNVINILAALNLFQPHVPKYDSTVVVELHHIKDKNTHAVKVLYLRNVSSEFEEQKLEGCEALCPLDDFIRITKPHVPVNYTEECHSQINLD